MDKNKFKVRNYFNFILLLIILVFLNERTQGLVQITKSIRDGNYDF